MSPQENRAWISLWSMCPPYLVYFAIQIGLPGWVASLSVVERFALLAAAPCSHAAVYVAGLVFLKQKERGAGLLADERDRAIDAGATRTAYYALMAGTVVVGMFMPFGQDSWKTVNTAFFVIVLCEAVRNVLTVRGYRGTPRFAQ